MNDYLFRLLKPNLVYRVRQITRLLSASTKIAHLYGLHPEGPVLWYAFLRDRKRMAEEESAAIKALLKKLVPNPDSPLTIADIRKTTVEQLIAEYKLSRLEADFIDLAF